MKVYFRNSLKALVLLSIIFSLNSCKDKEEVEPPIVAEDSPNVAVNKWIKDVMDEVYFWLDDMKTPIASSSDPEDYYESLLFRPTDRFSAIYPDYQELINSLQGINKEAGYEFSLVRESNENENVLAFVTYIKKGSPAASKDVRRGDVINQINGQSMNLNNYRTLLGQIGDSHSITFLRYNAVTGQYSAQAPVSLETVSLAENPNFLDTVYTINNQKIGYAVYHFFAPGIDGQPTRYDDQADEIFAKFKAEGINHLILDFRYNGGGFVSSAVNLASLIAPNVKSTDVFSKTKYNSFLMSFSQFQNNNTPFKNKSQNLGPILSGNKIYIITSSRTASASELIINGLKPYMDVVVIGGRTVGKNVGSIALEDEENPKNNYGILPIVTRSFNSLDQSDYGNGFPADVEGNELSQPVLLPLGDTNEYLLKLAIGKITAQPSGRMNLVDRLDIGSSMESKVRFGRMIEENIELFDK
ncbi:S41 family peptidase [Rhodonellum sp.]|uniref:S41 family peptidase n=1 Tax=Rhodonellum sp. TaxID=2231180 RepID=UPI0027212849|nr:S41 family peptidase [Rhodonellum sp.]MDO9554148.1 S41 family peptidase [Rhodonellum sp.]